MFLLIALVVTLALLAVGVPHLWLRLSAMQAAQARLAAISAIVPAQTFLAELRGHRARLFFAGAGDEQAAADSRRRRNGSAS